MPDIGEPGKVLPGEEIPIGLELARAQIEILRSVEREERRTGGRPPLELVRDEPDEAA